MLIQNGNKFEIKMLVHGFPCRTQSADLCNSIIRFISFIAMAPRKCRRPTPVSLRIHHTNDEIQNALKICFFNFLFRCHFNRKSIEYRAARWINRMNWKIQWSKNESRVCFHYLLLLVLFVCAVTCSIISKKWIINSLLNKIPDNRSGNQKTQKGQK